MYALPTDMKIKPQKHHVFETRAQLLVKKMEREFLEKTQKKKTNSDGRRKRDPELRRRTERNRHAHSESRGKRAASDHALDENHRLSESKSNSRQNGSENKSKGKNRATKPRHGRE